MKIVDPPPRVGPSRPGPHRMRPVGSTRNCAGRMHKIGVLSAALQNFRGVGMQLSQMWREHLKAGCPPEMHGLNIAGTAASALDDEITACVSACVTHSLKM